MRVAGVYVPGFDSWGTRPGFARPTGCTPPRLPGHGMPILGTEVPQAPLGEQNTLTFSLGHGERATESLGMPISHVTEPPRDTPRSIFEKGPATLLPQGMRSPRDPVARTLGGNGFFSFRKRNFSK
jgi:hypothetical protein